MTKFIVHIGDGKCGSTAIQTALYRSRAELAACAIHFDTLAPKSGHTALALLAGQRSRAGSEFRDKLAHKIFKLLTKTCGDFEWVILSAENFVNLEPDDAIDLIATIGCPIESLHVIAYVRDPMEMYASTIQQVVKGSHHFPRPENYHRRIDRKLKAWQDRVGASCMEVGLFERGALPDGDVVTDFAARLSRITGRDVALRPATPNRSLSAEQACVLQRFRRAVYPDEPDALRPRSTVLAQFFLTLNDKAFLVGNPLALSDLAREVVQCRNADVVEGLRAAFPDLVFGPTPLPGSALPPGPYPWSEDKRIEKVLAVCDPAVVDALCALLPELNGGVSPDRAQIEAIMAALGFVTESDRQTFLAAWEAYHADLLKFER